MSFLEKVYNELKKIQEFSESFKLRSTFSLLDLDNDIFIDIFFESIENTL